MKKSEAIDILMGSFSHPTTTPHMNAPDRGEYVSTEQQNLLDSVIEPVLVEAYTSDWTKKFTPFKNEKYCMYCIAKNGGNELLYDTDSKEFSLAKRNEQGKLYIVGYSSTDALTEWLG